MSLCHYVPVLSEKVRGLEKNRMGRGQTDNSARHGQTLRLLEKIGQKAYSLKIPHRGHTESLQWGEQTLPPSSNFWTMSKRKILLCPPHPTFGQCPKERFFICFETSRLIQARQKLVSIKPSEFVLPNFKWKAFIQNIWFHQTHCYFWSFIQFYSCNVAVDLRCCKLFTASLLCGRYCVS